MSEPRLNNGDLSLAGHLRRRLAKDSGFLLHPARILESYSLANLRPDLVAGLTVAVVLLPQAIAYSMIAELPPQVGLYAAVVAAIFGALWGSSYHLHTGPTNATSLLVLASLLSVAQPGTPEFITAACVLALMVGVVKLLMGLMRLGVLVNFVADSVVLGFIAGAGVLIGVNQLSHLLRVDIPSSPEIIYTIGGLWRAAPQAHLPSLGLGLGTMGIMAAIMRLRRGWPAGLIGMVCAALATGVLGLDAQGVAVLGALPRSLPPLTNLSSLTPDIFFSLSAGALAVSAIGLVEAVSSGRSIAAQSGQRLDSNQEFVGQGIANIMAGLLSGYPVSGSPSRTAINYRAGGQTPLAGVFSGLWVMLAMFLMAPLVAYLPRAALSGVLLVTAFGMVDRVEIRKVVRTSLGDSSILLATFLATLFLPLEFAVLAGMLVSFGRYLIKTSTPSVYPVVPDENFRHFRRMDDDVACPQLGLVKIEGSLYFGAVNHVEEEIRRIQNENPRQNFLLLRLSMVDHCDVSGIHMLEAVVKQYRQRGGDVFLSGVRPRVMHMMKLYGFDTFLGGDNILTGDDVVGHLFHRVLHPGFCVYECKERVFAECQALPKDDHAADLPEDVTLAGHVVDVISPMVLKLLQDDPEDDVLIIDVREPSEFRNWHIRGSYNVPLRYLAEKGPGLPADSSIVFVSRVGRRSELAAVIMQDLDHPRLFNLKGGILAWEAGGFPIAVE